MKPDYTIRPYTTTNGKWLVHGPGCGSFGMMVDDEDKAKYLARVLEDAFAIGYEQGRLDVRSRDTVYHDVDQYYPKDLSATDAATILHDASKPPPCPNPTNPQCDCRECKEIG